MMKWIKKLFDRKPKPAAACPYEIPGVVEVTFDDLPPVFTGTTADYPDAVKARLAFLYGICFMN